MLISLMLMRMNKSTAIDKYKDLVRSSISGIDFNERVDYNTAHVDWDDFTDSYEDEYRSCVKR